jgi:hypothetical protein
VSTTRIRTLVAAVSAAGLALALAGLPATAAAQEPAAQFEANTTSNMVYGWGFGSPVAVSIAGQT